jgi:hypothetical protein
VARFAISLGDFIANLNYNRYKYRDGNVVILDFLFVYSVRVFGHRLCVSYSSSTLENNSQPSVFSQLFTTSSPTSGAPLNDLVAPIVLGALFSVTFASHIPRTMLYSQTP